MGWVNVGHCGWLVSGEVRVGLGSLEEVNSHQVWEVWVTDPMAEAMQAVWVVWSCPSSG
jgi:hypothetical protein